MRDRNGEPMFGPEAITRIVMIAAIIAVSWWLESVIRSVVKGPIRSGFEAIGLVDPQPPSHPQYRRVTGAD